MMLKRLKEIKLNKSERQRSWEWETIQVRLYKERSESVNSINIIPLLGIWYDYRLG